MNKIKVLSHLQLNSLNLQANFDLIYISDSFDWQQDYQQVAQLKINRKLLWIVADDIDDLWLINSGVQNNFKLINYQQISLIRQFIKQSLLTNYSLVVSCTAGISRSAAVGWYASQLATKQVTSDFIKQYQKRILPNACWYLLFNKYRLTQSNWNQINDKRYGIFNLGRNDEI